MAFEERIDRGVARGDIAGLSELETSKVLRNTYMLLAMTIGFSVVTGAISAAMGVGFINPWLFLIGVFGLSFLVHKTANSAMGLVSVFLFTGFIGFCVGPMLNALMQIPNGTSNVMMALGMTAVAFLGLSGYAVISRKDFSFLTGFITIGLFVMLGAIVLSLLFDLGAFQLAISAGIVLLMSALILWQTSAIVHGGETNYIIATVTLYMSIYNLFMSLLHLVMAFSGDD